METIALILGTIGTVFGGLSAIATGLVGYLGNLRLESHKSELQATNNRLNNLAATSIHVTKVQFDKEFAIYQEIWCRLVTLRQKTLSLRPIMDSVDPNEAEDDRTKRRLTEFQDAYNEFIHSIENEKPFYAPDVYDALVEINQLCYTEAIEYQYKDPTQIRDYWESSKENSQKIIASIDDCCESIRTRIDSLAVME